MAVREVSSFCRICGGGCGVRMTVEDNKITSIRGDKNQPLSQGYACGKGLQAPEFHHGPERLLHPLKRMEDGSFQKIGLEQALDEIGEKLRAIVGENGADALGIYVGGGSSFNAASLAMQTAFMQAIGSRSLFSTLTIDQAAKVISFERMGGWAAGVQDFDESDVILIIGANPLISHVISALVTNPVRRIKQAKQRGMKLIVIDPRLSETARHADLFLQPLPGQDVAILCGMMRVILHEGWEDAEFCAQHIDPASMARLRETVEPFEETAVEERAGLQPGQIRALAQMFARDAKKGAAYGATGLCMAPYGNTGLHMMDCLNMICGRVKRAGDKAQFDTLSPKHPIHAEVIPPPRSWNQVPPSRIRGIGRLAGERLTSTLAEEILTPGEGQVKAFLVVGSNPAVNVPDQRRIVEAFKSLDLLVSVEAYMTETAALSDYILPVILQYERADLPLSIDGYALFPTTWVQYAPQVVEPPQDSDLIEDARFYWEIAKRLGCQITFRGEPLPMDVAPTTEELLQLRMRGARISLEELKQHPSGLILEDPDAIVLPGRPEANARLDVMPVDVVEEISGFRKHNVDARTIVGVHENYTHLLSVRRMRELFCSSGRHLTQVKLRAPHNPAHLHPDEFGPLGIKPGQTILISSRHGQVKAIVEEDDSLRPGVISLSHGWGGLPDEEGADEACVNLLISSRDDVQSINAMPLMSSIPVRIEPVNNDAKVYEDSDAHALQNA